MAMQQIVTTINLSVEDPSPSSSSWKTLLAVSQELHHHRQVGRPFSLSPKSFTIIVFFVGHYLFSLNDTEASLVCLVHQLRAPYNRWEETKQAFCRGNCSFSRG
ncbi:hypothetical protein SESBI_24665 [Sesbania bispinosa]|nr:hypothetical protein SESBI_24665 [Sesbania bispinosa]